MRQIIKYSLHPALTLLFTFCFQLPYAASAQEAFDVRANYIKSERQITMRDGVKLFTSIYAPRDTSTKYPIMLTRTPYNIGPYGPDAYKTAVGPSLEFMKENYIFVYQDVRGRFMSEGDFRMMTPQRSDNKGSSGVDESTDTYDTIEWLIKNIPNNNGRVGMWGISYPGFYTAAGIIGAHPALKADSPQAPMADTFIGDDFHHNGAFFLPHTFNFLAVFGQPRTGPTTQWGPFFNHGMPDGYKFFLELEPLKNVNTKYFKNNIALWNECMRHGNYDEYWKAQNLLPHLKGIKPAVMIVGGWFDAEDLFGALNIYKTIEKENPGATNTIVMGPWFHGGWARSEGDALGNVRFGSKTSQYYRQEVELPFFNYYLKDKGKINQPEALVFETGSNQWKSYDQWPPKNEVESDLYLRVEGGLSFSAPAGKTESPYDEYVSDPKKPVPFTSDITPLMTREYMVEDQRFASRRPDVLVYQTTALDENLTITGPIEASLFVSTSGTDCDWIVKLIDVYPDNAVDNQPNPCNIRMGGFQMLVRGDVMRSKFRNSYESPQRMEPGKVTKVEFEMRDVNHAFLKGHKVMVQIQSTWFPLVDINPQKFVDIYNASEADFQKATQRVYRSSLYPSHLAVNVLK